MLCTIRGLQECSLNLDFEFFPLGCNDGVSICVEDVFYKNGGPIDFLFLVARVLMVLFYRVYVHCGN